MPNEADNVLVGRGDGDLLGDLVKIEAEHGIRVMDQVGWSIIKFVIILKLVNIMAKQVERAVDAILYWFPFLRRTFRRPVLKSSACSLRLEIGDIDFTIAPGNTVLAPTTVLPGTLAPGAQPS